MFLLSIQTNSEHLERREILEIIKESLKDHITIRKNEADRLEQCSSRYKLIIDESQDESAIRLLFAYGILDENAKIHMCSEFLEECDLHVRVVKQFFCLN